MNLAMVVDLIFLFLTMVLMVKGLLKGFLGEIISLVATVGGVFLALNFADEGGRMIMEFLPEVSPVVAKGTAMVCVFVMTALVGAVVGKVSKAFLSLASLTFMDRILGIMAGAVKSLALLMVLFVIVNISGPLVPKELMDQSRSMAIARVVWPHIAPYVIRSGLVLENKDTGSVL